MEIAELVSDAVTLKYALKALKKEDMKIGVYPIERGTELEIVHEEDDFFVARHPKDGDVLVPYTSGHYYKPILRQDSVTP